FNSQNVTADIFLRVLEGDRKLKESGLKVLESGPEDNVFIYYSDHGAPNLLTFPKGLLYAKQLNKTLANMYREKRFKKMVIYIEACHSGSMFRWILPHNVNVWAVTAANPTELSWATFCEDPAITTCLSDEFSYQWMNDTEKYRGQLFNRSMLDQYLNVKPAVKGSHVMEYGDIKISFLPVGEFQGNSTHVGSSGFNGDSVNQVMCTSIWIAIKTYTIITKSSASVFNK
ncbi:Cysteine protease, partial [Fasciola gigantica]